MSGDCSDLALTPTLTMLLIVVILCNRRRRRRQCPVPSVESGGLSPGYRRKVETPPPLIVTSIDAIVELAWYIELGYPRTLLCGAFLKELLYTNQD